MNDQYRVELWLSRMLRTGVNLSLLLVLSGMAVNFFTRQSWLGETDLSELLSGNLGLRSDPPRHLAEFFFGFASLQSLNFVQGSILVLILLPAFRVAFLLGSFLRQRDWVFSGLAAIVLVLMSVGTILKLFE